MSWTAGQLGGPFTSKAAIAFEFGEEFASRVLDTARYGTVIYAAVRTSDGRRVFGLVLLAERSGGILYTKPISEEKGPAEDGCPERILDLLTETTDEDAREWRARCRARIDRARLGPGQEVTFNEPLKFLDGTEHRRLTFLAGSHFRSGEGALNHVSSGWTLDYELADDQEEQAHAATLTREERRRAEEADARGDFASIDSEIGRLADARDATAQALEELRRRPCARGRDIRGFESQLRAYDAELVELRRRSV
jgi:hypothetical protein